MKKNQIKNIVLHIAKDTRPSSLADGINELHVQVIERTLNQSNLTTAQKLDVIDKIIKNLKSGETQGAH